MINSSELKQPINEFITFVDSYIDSLSKSNDSKEVDTKLSSLRNEILDYINENKEIEELRHSCTYIKNDFSKIKNRENIDGAKIRTIEKLKIIKHYINKNKLNFIDHKTDFDEYNSILILKKILNNFHLHTKSMYLDKCHGKGKIQNDQLDLIKIGNEYDVQRMLYSLIKPIFPDAKTEVVEDVGCSTVRYDIDIDSCETTIEVKCSRTNMTERSLNEEMGSDSFHYKRKNIIFFVYDKESIISNVESYKKTYNRLFDDKYIDIIVIQAIKL
ncbi:MAG: hypothetical protein ACRCXA_11300 [Peptostreptococcaceae bacterium]